mmetsp:Transcript_10050/g.18635  ORF Transcript_10050/g.18635 Transcript_10050/m.18635 type:complete len:363 (-) Transcript_10050:219-1307(-)|eukprot:CAMPEP_0175040742 /NCGR_PEP_ID=MMETSP0052_2-20121109/1455_1 /TAXON_ID=51329 ORGANISM="Polytomella parva, Strain SAG 63-3" /NCGR_SAMPLE_ID=MMETSP0052_2 /ASSEMBLY_ACC=CAM_ASM_000194 /LENGTH=362 /DNA_ID=CAMNT_0016303033 /DNA_START=143 /DNA_END=1231 /DNA_ORIENTATION=-
MPPKSSVSENIHKDEPAPKSSDQIQAESLKEKGNKFYAMGKNHAAIEEYSEAILFCPNWAVLYVNRAVCFRRLGEWRRVKEDATKALDLDRNYMKAHFLLGLAYASGEVAQPPVLDSLTYGYSFDGTIPSNSVFSKSPDSSVASATSRLISHLLNGNGAGKKNIGVQNPIPDPSAAAAKVAQAERDEDESLAISIKHLSRAYDLAREKNNNVSAQAEVWRELAVVQYRQWKRQAAAAKSRRQALQNEIHQLLGLELSTPLPPRWAAVFKDLEKLDLAPEAPPEVPSALTCPLTTSVLRDPVIARPSGRSYERAMLLEHLSKVGKFEPVTRQPMTEADLVPNVCLRHTIMQYLHEHPWAWGEA